MCSGFPNGPSSLGAQAQRREQARNSLSDAGLPEVVIDLHLARCGLGAASAIDLPELAARLAILLRALRASPPDGTLLAAPVSDLYDDPRGYGTPSAPRNRRLRSSSSPAPPTPPRRPRMRPSRTSSAPGAASATRQIPGPCPPEWRNQESGVNAYPVGPFTTNLEEPTTDVRWVRRRANNSVIPWSTTRLSRVSKAINTTTTDAWKASVHTRLRLSALIAGEGYVSRRNHGTDARPTSSEMAPGPANAAPSGPIHRPGGKTTSRVFAPFSITGAATIFSPSRN